MKWFSIFIGLIIFGLAGKAQQNYFIYLQTDNRQPFYVKIDKELYSSSSSGYAIIPKLHKGPYILNIGFPKKEWPEQKIAINVADDAGYSLKNFNEKGWGLFNLQSLAVSMADNDPNTETTITEANDFAGTLATVVNTPSLNEKKVPVKKAIEEPAIKEVPEEVVVVAVENKEQNTIPEDVEPAIVFKEESINSAEKPISLNTIQRISKAADMQGFAMVYIDKTENKIDTVRIFIADLSPNRKLETENNNPASAVKPAEEIKEVKKQEAIIENNTVEDKRFLNIELPNPNGREVSVEESAQNEKEAIVPKKEKVKKVAKPAAEKETIATVSTETKGKLTFNSDCKAIASDDDFLKTRKKMASETNADDMIKAAKKRFKSACYSTEQIKNLSVLFLKDETRYNFFDAAYPFVHDTQNFADLVTALSDEYYITRFKAMLR